jgi:hypothetical protein
VDVYEFICRHVFLSSICWLFLLFPPRRWCFLSNFLRSRSEMRARSFFFRHSCLSFLSLKCASTIALRPPNLWHSLFSLFSPFSFGSSLLV